MTEILRFLPSTNPLRVISTAALFMPTVPGPDHGATFTVSPLTDERPAVEADAAGIAAGALASDRLPPLTGVRVLVIDDDADARELMSAVLAHCGAEVTVAATAWSRWRRSARGGSMS